MSDMCPMYQNREVAKRKYPVLDYIEGVMSEPHYDGIVNEIWL